MKNNFKKLYIIIFSLILIFAIFWFFYFISQKAGNFLFDVYKNNQSITVYDRNKNIIEIKPNYRGYYATYLNNIPARFSDLLLRKEDKYFYFHPGINPLSITRSIFTRLFYFKEEGSSTITQQLTKILLENEKKRNLKNKIKELLCSFALEINFSKKEILKMYLNSIYFGNSIQGINEASLYYFGKSPEALSDDEIIQLLATINSPSLTPPNTNDNIEKAKNLSKNLNLKNLQFSLISDDEAKKRLNNYKNLIKQPTAFELKSAGIDCNSNCQTSIDLDLNENIRSIAKRILNNLVNKNTTNAAVVVLTEPSNEILALIGSPDPTINAYGYQINMALKPRPIGSTIKPFIYLKGFNKNLRPYTKVMDQEYKYIINDGFALYPKNYDYKYQGEVDLHYSLSNSLNVPTVQVLEYVGQDNFSDFLTSGLHFKPTQDIKSYGLGIALGGLEMDLLSLTNYYSIFTNNGELKPIKIGNNAIGPKYNSNADFSWQKKVSEKKYIELINKILSDRMTGVEQFGLKSSLNLPSVNYAVKTGTSREYHDSWTIGYTSDFIVGVWVGNSDDKAMDRVSGQLGAGKIWQETMNLLLNSKYSQNRSFQFDLIKDHTGKHGIEWGLDSDDFEKYLELLTEKRLILKPHNNDIFRFDKNEKIICQSDQTVLWIINNEKKDKSSEYFFTPTSSGEYKITADNGKEQESVLILVKNSE